MSDWRVDQEVVHELNKLDPIVELLQKNGIGYPRNGHGFIVELGWAHHALIEFTDGTRALCLLSCLRPWNAP